MHKNDRQTRRTILSQSMSMQEMALGKRVETCLERIKELEEQLREIRLSAHAVLAEVSSGEATDSMAVINLRRAVAQ